MAKFGYAIGPDDSEKIKRIGTFLLIIGIICAVLWVIISFVTMSGTSAGMSDWFVAILQAGAFVIGGWIASTVIKSIAKIMQQTYYIQRSLEEDLYYRLSSVDDKVSNK